MTGMALLLKHILKQALSKPAGDPVFPGFNDMRLQLFGWHDLRFSF